MSPAVFAHGNLRLYLLNLLSESSMHGYELIQALDERFGGTYKPSAGTIYPRLAKLADEGLVTKTADGRKSTYAITDAGRRELEERHGELEAIETDVTDSVRRLADEVRASVNEAMKSLRADLASAARDARAEPPRGPTSAARTRSTDSRFRLQEAEGAINDFRLEMREALRDRAQSNELGAEAVTLLQSRLHDVAREVREALRAR
jgi:DNA-binding PadR family transcriptional regulator